MKDVKIGLLKEFCLRTVYLDFAISFGITGLFIFLFFINSIISNTLKNVYSLNLVTSLFLILLIENLFHRQLGSFLFSLIIILAIFLETLKMKKILVVDWLDKYGGAERLPTSFNKSFNFSRCYTLINNMPDENLKKVFLRNDIEIIESPLKILKSKFRYLFFFSILYIKFKSKKINV